MELDTEKTIYLGIDGTNGTLHVLTPRGFEKKFGLEIQELKLDDPNPSSTDAAQFKLLAEEMEEVRYDL